MKSSLIPVTRIVVVKSSFATYRWGNRVCKKVTWLLFLVVYHHARVLPFLTEFQLRWGVPPSFMAGLCVVQDGPWPQPLGYSNKGLELWFPPWRHWGHLGSSVKHTVPGAHSQKLWSGFGTRGADMGFSVVSRWCWSTAKVEKHWPQQILEVPRFLPAVGLGLN